MIGYRPLHALCLSPLATSASGFLVVDGVPKVQWATFEDHTQRKHDSDSKPRQQCLGCYFIHPPFFPSWSGLGPPVRLFLWLLESVDPSALGCVFFIPSATLNGRLIPSPFSSPLLIFPPSLAHASFPSSTDMKFKNFDPFFPCQRTVFVDRCSE